jgi:Do/DeqQ family serine protease
MDYRLLSETIKFLVQSVIGGLAIAFVILIFFPDLLPSRQGADAPAAVTGATPAQTLSYHAAIRRVAPAVVNVYTTQLVQRPLNPLLQDPLFRRFFGIPEPGQQLNSSLGSGVIFDQHGYILTNAHVINKATAIQITLADGRQTRASIVGIDRETDLAVLKVNLKNLPAAPIGDSDHLQVGDVVLAIGSPYNLNQTVTQGIVSAIGRQRVGISAIEDFIQTDADINPGNSGGALVGSDGRLVGINTAIYTQSGGSQGIGFAIPINLAVGVMQQLRDNGYVVRGWLGAEVQVIPQDIIDATGLKHGVLISVVFNNGPVARAGLQPGDIITSIDGQDLYSPQQYNKIITGLKPGATIRLEVLRGWDKITVSAQVIQQPTYPQ